MTVHRWWRGDPAPGAEWTRRAVETTQGHRLREWGDDVPAMLTGSDDVRHASNLVRYWLLWRYGGLWLDHDVIPLTDLCRGGPFVATLGNVRCGAVMWFPQPKHPMTKDLFEAARAAPPGPSPRRSGDHLLTRVAADHPDVLADRGVLGFDRTGAALGAPVRAVHLWTTSAAL